MTCSRSSANFVGLSVPKLSTLATEYTPVWNALVSAKLTFIPHLLKSNAHLSFWPNYIAKIWVRITFNGAFTFASKYFSGFKVLKREVRSLDSMVH